MSESMTAARRQLRVGVVRIINGAANENVSDEEGRGRLAIVCRGKPELEAAVELFKQWRALAHPTAAK